MSSPITFSGFNNIDFNVVLNALMAQASQPLAALQNRQSALKSQITTINTLSARVDELRSAAEALGSISSISTTAGRSSDTGAVTVSSGPAAVPARYDVVVTTLARAQVTPSVETFADADTTIVAGGGSITIGGVEVAISGDVTLQGLADAINATDGIGVTAAAIRTGPDSYRLTLTSTLTGVEHAFTVSNNLTGGTGISFGANAVEASDAAITINNIPATSSSNVFESIAAGVTVTVHRADPDATVSIDIEPDSSAFVAKVEAFVEAYNNILSFIDRQRLSAASGDASSIAGDPIVRQLRSSLRSALLGAHGDGTFTHLAEVGVVLGRDGRLSLDRRMFDAALETDGDAVRALFAGDDGVFPAIGSMLDEYTRAGGMLRSATDRLDRQVKAMDTQILALQDRLALQREALQRQFTEADAAMSRLRSQSDSLASLY